jgi:hypothetical protein
MEDNSLKHLNFFISLIDNNFPFSLIRPGDGEYMIMNNISFKTQDKWSYKINGRLTSDLINVKDLLKQKNLFVGLPCKDCQGQEVFNWFVKTWELNTNQITYANIFCNKNWDRINSYISNKKFYYIGPGDKKNNLIKDRFLISELLVENWDLEYEKIYIEINTWVSNILENNQENNLFLFSCGPISKILIPRLFNKYPGNTFLDFGSSLDLLTKGSSNRPYMNKNNHYSNIVCDFYRGHTFYSKNDIDFFNGGWSYTPNEMKEFLKYLTLKDKYSVLEFGSGDSTKKLYDIISRFCYEIEYHTYENDINYFVNYKNVKTILYDNIDNVEIPDNKYDIIIVDGPHGINRMKWFSKFKNNIKYDSLLLIDDFNHYKEFKEQLDYNFEYKILSLSDVKFVPNGEHSWILVTNIMAKF